MKAIIKKSLSLLLVVCMTLSLAACNKTEKTKESEEVKIELSLLDFFIPGDGVTQAFEPLFKQFLEDHPNVTIDEESISNADTATKVQTLAVANELPDIFMIKGQMAKSFVENEKVYPLDEILNSEPEWQNNFKEGVFSNFIIEGKTYGIPFQVTNTCIYYNSAMFEQAGISEFPSTWDDLLVAVEKLKMIDIVPIALGNKEKWNAESVIMSTLGNRSTGNEWYQSIRENNGAKFTDDVFVEALTALSDLAVAGAFNVDVNSIDGAQQRQMYMNGKAAMTIDGTWAISDFDSNSPQEVLEATEIAALPSLTGGLGNQEAITGGAGWAFAINADIEPEKLEAAKAFLVAMTGKEYAKLAIESGTLTAAYPSERKVDTSKVIQTKFDTFAEGRPFIPVYDHQLSSGVIEVMNIGLQELLIGLVTPIELAERIQLEYER